MITVTPDRRFYVLILLGSFTVLAACGTVEVNNSPADLVERTSKEVAESCEKPPGETTVDSRTSRYRTIIRSEMKGDTNFAGCWRVVQIGCGTSCQQVAFLHPESETVVWGPIANYGVDYDVNSNLLVVNPEDVLKKENAENLDWVETKRYVLDHEEARVKRLP